MQLVLAQMSAEAGASATPDEAELRRRWAAAYRGALRASLEEIERAEAASDAAGAARGGSDPSETRSSRVATAARFRSSQRCSLHAQLAEMPTL